MRVLYSFLDTPGTPRIGTAALEQVRSPSRLEIDVHVAATALAANPGVPCTLTLTAAGRRVRHGALGRDRAGSLRAYWQAVERDRPPPAHREPAGAERVR